MMLSDLSAHTTWFTALSQNFPTNKKSKVSSSNNATKFLGNLAEKIFERQTKATLEVKTRHSVTTVKGG